MSFRKISFLLFSSLFMIFLSNTTCNAQRLTPAQQRQLQREQERLIKHAKNYLGLKTKFENLNKRYEPLVTNPLFNTTTDSDFVQAKETANEKKQTLEKFFTETDAKIEEAKRAFAAAIQNPALTELTSLSDESIKEVQVTMKENVNSFGKAIKTIETKFATPVTPVAKPIPAPVTPTVKPAPATVAAPAPVTPTPPVTPVVKSVPAPAPVTPAPKPVTTPTPPAA
jgi:hypothetical protein